MNKLERERLVLVESIRKMEATRLERVEHIRQKSREERTPLEEHTLGLSKMLTLHGQEDEFGQQADTGDSERLLGVRAADAQRDRALWTRLAEVEGQLASLEQERTSLINKIDELASSNRTSRKISGHKLALVSSKTSSE